MGAAKRVSFRFGDVVQLEPKADGRTGYRVQLVGVLPGLSLLVTAPDVRGQPVALADGEAFDVRVFNGDDALAFTSTVLRSCREPYPYVHLTYPEKIEQVQVRNARRARLQLAAQITLLRDGIDDQLFPAIERVGPVRQGTIRDISTAGAQLEAPVALGPVGTHMIITTQLAFDRVSGRNVVLPAEIRNVREIPDDQGVISFHYGVQFIELTPEADLALSAFVYRHLAAQLLGESAS